MNLTARTILRPGRWGATAGVALIAIGLLSFNAFAWFTAEQNVTHDTDSGTMTLTLGSTGSVTNRFNIASTDIAPGDTIQRTLTVTAGGSVTMDDIALEITAPTTSLLDSNANGLQVIVERCPGGQWSESGPPYTYSCGGGASTVYSSRSVMQAKADGVVNLTGENTSGANYLRVTLTFSTAADDTFQNLASQLEFTWTGDQRAGTDK